MPLDPTLTSAPGRRASALQVPAFKLYGEVGAPGAEMLHIEEIASRSRLYRWEIAAHVHRGLFQVVWLDAGAVELALDELRESAQAPAAIVVPPGVVHAFRFASDTQGWVLTFSARQLVEGDATGAGESFATLFAAPALLRLAEPGRIAALLRELAAESGAAGAEGSPTVGWLARSVVWHLARSRERSARSAPPRQEALFARFVQLVERHHLEHWPVTRYAERLGLSAERLNRLVRDSAGRSALAFVHERVLREACRRLLYIAAPVSTLAFELGFEDPAYFCRFFKRHTGVSPRDYRVQQAAAQGLR
jgi:AraC family transcriptional regulator, transcriptional activator of pobA